MGCAAPVPTSEDAPARLCPVKRNLVTRSRAVLVALALAAGTAGCSVNSPFQTAETMSLGDGVPVDLESAQVRNLALVSGGQGGEATVTGTVENTSGKPLTFSLSVGDASVRTRIPAHQTVSLSEDKHLTLDKVDAGPGDMTDAEVSDGSETTPVSVPVLDPAGYYEDYAPEGWTPTPGPTKADDGESEGH